MVSRAAWVVAVLVFCTAVGSVALASAGSGSGAKTQRGVEKRGIRGRQGPQGATGPQGPAGDPAEFDVTYTGFPADHFTAAPDTSTVGEIDCPAGLHVIGGGLTSSAPFGTLSVGNDNAFDSNTWLVEVENLNQQTPEKFGVSAVCVSSQLAKRAPARAGKRGRRGPRGVTGPQGPQGPKGSDAVPLTYVQKDFTADGNKQTSAEAHCADDQINVGGGLFSQGRFRTQWMQDSHSLGNAGWGASVDTFGTAPRGATVYAICEPFRLAAQGPKAKAAREGKRGRRGPRGPRGATGPQGQQGPPAADDITLTLRYVSQNFTVSPGTQGHGEADCPAGEHVVGGGVTAGVARRSVVNSSRPVGSGTGWEAFVDNIASSTPTTSTVTAVCASPTTVAEGQ